MLTVYKASAGSGKTFTLAKTYISLLLGIKNPDGTYRLNHPDFGKAFANRHGRILAITFTNKATEEMKTRIINELSILADPATVAKSDYFTDFTKQFNCTQQQLSQSAKVAMEQLLNGYSDFNVTTIDSFFQTVLRAMAFELDYPGDYEVVLESDAVIAEAVSMMLDDFNSFPSADLKDPVSVALIDFMREERDSSGKFNIFNRRAQIFRNMVSSSKDLFDERYHLVADNFEKWLNNPTSVPDLIKTLDYWKDFLIARNKMLVVQFRKILTDNDIDYADVCTTVNKRIQECESGTAMSTKAFSQSTFEKVFKDNGLTAKSLFRPNAKALKKCDDITARDLHFTFRRMVRNFARLYDVQTIRNSVGTYRFMKVLTDNIHRFTNDRNVVVLADTNRLLHDVMDKGNVPFVYEKIGTALSHFLIDEFQDTSALQWKNLIPLVENGLAEGNDSLIIGDEKQSIYRFRNSDSTLLHHQVADYFGANVLPRGHRKGENTNWRSSGVIVRFNNHLFDILAKSLGVLGYENVAQDIPPKHQEEDGYIHFFPISANNANDGEQTETVPQSTEELMAEQILHQHDNGYAWQDIAVLVPTNSLCRQFGRALLAHGIPIATEEALLISANPSVALVVSTLRMIIEATESKAHDNNRLNISAFKSRFMFQYNSLLHQGLETDAAAAKAIENIFYSNQNLLSSSAVQDIIDTNPSTLYELVETIISKRISEAERARDMVFLAAFNDIAIQYSTNFGNNLVDFLRWWRTIAPKASIATPDNTDAVRVMTIHKAKGLEFKCVHLPDAGHALYNQTIVEKNWIHTPSHHSIFNTLPPALSIALSADTGFKMSRFYHLYTENKLARITDGLNRVYVAFTRPERELCAYYNPKSGFGKDLAKALATFSGFNTADSSLIIGMPTHPLPISKEEAEKINKKREATITLDSYDIPGRFKLSFEAMVDNRISISTTGIDPQPPVSVAKDKKPQTKKMQRAAQRGTAMHYALSCINARSVTLDVAMERAIKQARRRGLSSEDADTLRSLTTNPDTATALNRWFVNSLRVTSETPIHISTNPDDFVTDDSGMLRPDLIVWNTDKDIEIVDFKFTTEVQRSHIEQVRDYATMMRNVFPEASVTASLLYADLKKVVGVET